MGEDHVDRWNWMLLGFQCSHAGNENGVRIMIIITLEFMIYGELDR